MKKDRVKDLREKDALTVIGSSMSSMPTGLGSSCWTQNHRRANVASLVPSPEELIKNQNQKYEYKEKENAN